MLAATATAVKVVATTFSMQVLLFASELDVVTDLAPVTTSSITVLGSSFDVQLQPNSPSLPQLAQQLHCCGGAASTATGASTAQLLQSMPKLPGIGCGGSQSCSVGARVASFVVY